MASKEPDDIMPIVFKLLRSGASSCITMDHILQTELALKLLWGKGSAEERAVVLHVERIWLAFKDLGVGSLHDVARSKQMP